MQQWQLENTRLYFLIKDSVVISGDWEGLDRETTKVEASIHLRSKDFAAHERWLANLSDVITSNGLDDLWENQIVSNTGGGCTHGRVTYFTY